MTANIYTNADNETILKAASLINEGATVGATSKCKKCPELSFKNYFDIS